MVTLEELTMSMPLPVVFPTIANPKQSTMVLLAVIVAHEPFDVMFWVRLLDSVMLMGQVAMLADGKKKWPVGLSRGVL